MAQQVPQMAQQVPKEKPVHDIGLSFRQRLEDARKQLANLEWKCVPRNGEPTTDKGKLVKALCLLLEHRDKGVRLGKTDNTTPKYLQEQEYIEKIFTECKELDLDLEYGKKITSPILEEQEEDYQRWLNGILFYIVAYLTPYHTNVRGAS